MTGRMLPILTTLEPGQSLEVSGVSSLVVEVDGWACAVDSGEPGWAILQLTAGTKGEGHLLNFPDAAALSVRIPVLADGYLFGTSDTLYLTTKDGAAGPTVSVRCEGNGSIDLTSRYEVK